MENDDGILRCNVYLAFNSSVVLLVVINMFLSLVDAPAQMCQRPGGIRWNKPPQFAVILGECLGPCHNSTLHIKHLTDERSMGRVLEDLIVGLMP